MGANASHEGSFGPDELQKNAKPHSSGTVFSPYGRVSLRKSLRRRKKEKRKRKEDGTRDSSDKAEEPNVHLRKMDKLRKSFRDSFRKKKDGVHIPEAAKPHLWQSDEADVRNGTCNFQVKYMGCVEVYGSRGMEICEEALKVLRNSRRRPVRGILYVSGDGLRVVDDDTKGLLVDQTIEKVSFCAPDRNHERGFSYICRDGTTRRWMCHGFIAVKDTGERLSHAVGCAFAACLERKQKRDVECGVTMTFDQATSTFTRMGSFRQMSVTERLSDPQECKPIADPVPFKKVDNPHAIARPHATPQLLQRQGSFRVFNHLNQSSPFKRQLSLRLNDLPSNLERSRSHSLDNSSPIDLSSNVINNNVNTNDPPITESLSPTALPPHTQRNRLQSLPNVINMTPIPESAPLSDNKADAVSAMCQQVSAGLSLLSSFADPFGAPTTTSSDSFQSSPFLTNKTSNIFGDPLNNEDSSSLSSNAGHAVPPVSAPLPKPEEWLAQLNPASSVDVNNETPVLQHTTVAATQSPRRAPPLSQLRSTSLGCAPTETTERRYNFSTSFSAKLTNGTSSKPSDPFDAEWVSIDAGASNPNNPFLTNNTVTKAFQVQM